MTIPTRVRIPVALAFAAALTTVLACSGDDDGSTATDGGGVSTVPDGSFADTGASCPIINAGACLDPATQNCTSLTCTDGTWTCPTGSTIVGTCATAVDSGAEGDADVDAATDAGVDIDASCTNIVACPAIVTGGCVSQPTCVDGTNTCTLVCSDAGPDASADASTDATSDGPG